MRRSLLLLLWLISDIALFLFAYAVAYFMRVGWILSSDLPFGNFMLVVLAVSPLWIVALATTRTFALTRNQKTLRNAAYIVYGCAVGAALVALAYYFVYAQVFSRMILLLGTIYSSILIMLWHWMYEGIFRGALRRSPATFPTLIVGVTRESRQLIELLERRKNPLKPVAILDGAGAKEKDICGVPVLGKLNKLEEVLTTYKINHLIQCSDLEQSINLLSACRQRGITYMLLPSVMGIVEHDERIESLEGRSVTMVRPQGGWLQRFFR